MLDAQSVSRAGPVSHAERRQAQANVSRLEALDYRGDLFVKKYAQAVREAAQFALQSEQKLDFNKSALDAVTAELVGFAVLAYVIGKQRTKKDLSLAKSSFDAEIRRIAENFDIDLGDVTKNVSKIVGPRVKKSLTTVKQRINDALAEITTKSLPTKQAVRELTNRLEQMGLTPNSPGYVQTLVRSHSQMAYSAAQYQEFQQDEEIWGYQYVTVGDERVREEHEALDGLVRKRDDPIWDTIWPPNGWNCRCSVLAVYEPQRQTRVPRSATGLVDSAFDFNPGVALVA